MFGQHRCGQVRKLWYECPRLCKKCRKPRLHIPNACKNCCWWIRRHFGGIPRSRTLPSPPRYRPNLCISRELRKHDRRTVSSIDLFSLYVLFSHFRPRDATRGNNFFQMSSYARANVRITNEKKQKIKFPRGLQVVWNGKTIFSS